MTSTQDMRSLASECLLLVTFLVLLGSSIVWPVRALHGPVPADVRPLSDAAYSCGTVADPDFTHVSWANEDNANDPIARRLPPLEPLWGEALHESKKLLLALGVVPILAGIGVIVGVVRMVLAFRRRSGAWDRWKLLPPMTNTVAIIVSFAALIVVLCRATASVTAARTMFRIAVGASLFVGVNVRREPAPGRRRQAPGSSSFL
jgi:uncharacterized membrane protein HdeD (DUF308 family)